MPCSATTIAAAIIACAAQTIAPFLPRPKSAQSLQNLQYCKAAKLQSCKTEKLQDRTYKRFNVRNNDGCQTMYTMIVWTAVHIFVYAKVHSLLH